MEIVVKISKFKEIEGSFEFTHYDEYSVKFTESKKPHLWRVVVDGYLSTQLINILHPRANKGCKHVILNAISEKFNDELKVRVSKTISQDKVNNLYSKTVKKNLSNYVLNISKEASRDKLTQYKLI